MPETAVMIPQQPRRKPGRPRKGEEQPRLPINALRAIRYTIQGLTQQEIADQLNITRQRVGQLMHQYRTELETELALEMQVERLTLPLVPKAIRVINRILEDQNAADQDALKAAKDVLDRALGRPTQHNVTDERKLIEIVFRSLESPQPRQVIAATSQVAAAEDLRVGAPEVAAALVSGAEPPEGGS